MTMIQNAKRINAARLLTFMVDLVQFALEIGGVFLGAFAAFELTIFANSETRRKRVFEFSSY